MLQVPVEVSVACDRWCEQKLKCPLRQCRDGTSDSAKCARCAKVGASCVFSTSLRAGRPNASNNSSVTKRRESKSSNHATPWEAGTEDATEDMLLFSSQGDCFKQNLGDEGFGVQMGESSEAEVMGISRGHTAADEVARMTAMSIPNGAKSEYLNTPEFLNAVRLPGTEECWHQS